MADTATYSSPLSLEEDEQQFGTPIDDDQPSLVMSGDTVKEVGVDELLVEGYTPDGYNSSCTPCSSVVKSSFHVLLAALAAIMVPSVLLRELFGKIPYVGQLDENILRALLTVVIHVLLSRLIGKLF